MLKKIKNDFRTYLDDRRNVTYVKKQIASKQLQIKEIEIETVNRCNGKCSFCPVNANEPQREYAKMSTELFYKIIQELVDMNYTGMLSIYSNNEPFLDERIVDFYKYAREKLLGARLNLYTNGTLMSLDKFKEIVT